MHDVEFNLFIAVFEVLILAGSIIFAKFIAPRLQTQNVQEITMQVNLITQWAQSLVSWARQNLSGKSGNEKMQAVVHELVEIAGQHGIVMNETQITAIAQKAYDEMKSTDTVNTAVATTLANAVVTSATNPVNTEEKK